MSYVAAIKTAIKVYKLGPSVKLQAKVTKVGNQLKTNKKKDIKFSDFDIFKNKHMDKAQTELNKTLKSAEAAAKTKHVWPKDPSEKLFRNAVKIAKSKGVDSKEVKAAVSSYDTTLAIHIVNLAAPKNRLKEGDKEIEARIKDAKLIRDYTGALEKELLKVTKFVPLPAAQAKFFSLSQQAKQLNRTAGSIQSCYEKLLTKSKKLIAEGEHMLDERETWLEYIRKDNGKKELELSM